MRNRNRRQAGLTLVELLIATVLLALILLAIAPLFIMSVKSNYSANEYTSIHNLSRDRLEQLMNLPFNDVQLSPGPHNTSDLPPNLPDPVTGLPALTAPRNTLSRTYNVHLFTSTAPVTTGDPYTLTEVFGSGTAYDFKLIDVTVTSSSFNTLSGLGIGARTAQVSGIIRNLSPGQPDPLAPGP
jgi:prepilin-type N-terminal cleavage/methylation domain-containing protein